MSAAVETVVVADVAVAVVEGRMRCIAGVMEAAADLMTHIAAVALAVAECTQCTVAVWGVVADSLAYLLNKGLLVSRLTNYIQIEAGDLKEIRTLLCRAPQGLHRCSVAGGLFEVAWNIVSVEESWSGLVLVWNWTECEV